MERPPIPAELKRQVRQRCGFGCVICGSPIYDYDHIEDYASVREHSFENLVLLCPMCHRKKGTKGLITKEFVWASIKNVNTRARTSPDEIPPQPYTLEIGSNIIKTFRGCAFSILGFGILEIIFKGMPLINATIWDNKGEKAIEIKENNYTLCANTWDIEYVGATLTFRNGPREVFASITFDSEQKLIKLRGNIELRNGLKIRIGDDGIWAEQYLLARENEINSSEAGLIITDKPIQHPIRCGGGQVMYNVFQGIDGIAVGNSTNCIGNSFGACQICFLWTQSFLDSLKPI